ncbi:MAG: acetyltransferase [Planctomycetaceae bacterium]|nr:acetyltransferase [Planctomycetaceae bacterium]
MIEVPVAIIGAGGHARVVLQALRTMHVTVVALTDLHPENFPDGLDGCAVISDDELVRRYSCDEVMLACGVGSVTAATEDQLRRRIVRRFERQGYRSAQILHSNACIADTVSLAPGVQIHAGAVVQPGVTLEEHVIINTGATVDHDCRIGPFAHLAPGVTLSGNVTVHEGAHIGTGANVIQGITIGRFAIVAAGACVVRDVAANTVVMGVPARPKGR